MRDRIFFDTSILVYAFTIDEPKKHEKCKELVKKAFNGMIKGVVSNQVLSELFFVLTRKKGIEEQKAEIIVNSLILSDNWEKINYTHETVEKAKKLAIELNLSFWDALIAATLSENNIDKIYTENEKDFKKLKWLKVKNPLAQSS